MTNPHRPAAAFESADDFDDPADHDASVAEGLLRGRVLTRRLTAWEVKLDVLRTDTDLVLLEPLLGGDLLYTADGPIEWAEDSDRSEEIWDTVDHDGEPFDPDAGPDAVLALPVGSLAGMAAGQLIGIRLTPNGVILGAASPEPIPDSFAAAALAVLNGDSPAEDGRPPMPISMSEFTVGVMTNDRALFTQPLPPITEMIEAAGFQMIGTDIATADVDPREWRVTQDASEVALTFGLPIGGAITVAQLAPWVRWEAASQDAERGDEYGTVSEEPDIPPIPADRDALAGLLAELADPDVAEALFAAAVGFDGAAAGRLGEYATEWLAVAPRRARAAVLWIRGRCREHLGDVPAAEADFEAARMADTSWPPVLERLAGFAGDRGDAAAAISLLRQAGFDDEDDSVQQLLKLESPARRDLGRNQPCWCGSGRKYKVCHLGREYLPLESRTTWLYNKAREYALGGRHRGLIVALAQIRARFDPAPDAIERAIADPLVADTALFEGGALQAFLDERGYLLPDDELLAATGWLLRERSVYEVTKVRVGVGFDVRDIRSGDRLTVTEKLATRQLKVGMRILMRLLPVGETWQIFGGLEPVPMHQEERAVALCDELEAGTAGPADVVGFAAARFAPPTLVTTDGEPMVHCTATYRVADNASTAADLARLFEDVGGGSFTALADNGGSDGNGATVLGQLELSDNTLTLDTMNEKRFAALKAQLGALSGLRLVDEQRQSATAMMRGAGSSPAVPRATGDHGDPMDNPEMLEFLDGLMRHKEIEWCDERIPALSGFTPRQAAADPTRRDDLVRLLASFDDLTGPGTMQPGRLRAELGLQ